MRKNEVSFLVSGTFFLFAVLADIVLEFIGIQVFLFGTRVFTHFLGLMIIISVVSFAVLIFSLLKDRKENFGGKATVILKVLTCILMVVLILFSIILTLFTSEKNISKSVSNDKRHEILVETDSLSGNWDVTLYKRNTAFFKTVKASFEINDMVSDDEQISVIWYEDGCDVSYDCYSDYADSSASEIQTFTQRLYFTDKTK